MEPANPQGRVGRPSFEDLVALVARLHTPAPEGCPWCLAQTHHTLRDYLIEEAHEVAEAIDQDDPDALVDELGDVLVLVLTHAQLAQQAGHFALGDVVQGAVEKTLRRNPHVFADARASSPEEVLRQWEALKRQERAGDLSLLDGIPGSLPALLRAASMQERAAHVGFDWPDVSGVIDKVREEIQELAASPDRHRQAEELGDLLFSLVNLARRLGFSPEQVLQQANEKFARRFAALERACRERGLRPEELSLEELDALWEQAKRGELQGQPP